MSPVVSTWVSKSITFKSLTSSVSFNSQLSDINQINQLECRKLSKSNRSSQTFKPAVSKPLMWIRENIVISSSRNLTNSWNELIGQSRDFSATVSVSRIVWRHAVYSTRSHRQMHDSSLKVVDSKLNSPSTVECLVCVEQSIQRSLQVAHGQS